MIFTNYIRGIVQEHPELKLKLKKASSKQTPFLYVYQSIVMTIGSVFALLFLSFLIFREDLIALLVALLVNLVLSYPIYRFWFSYVDVQIRKTARELDCTIVSSLL